MTAVQAGALPVKRDMYRCGLSTSAVSCWLFISPHCVGYISHTAKFHYAPHASSETAEDFWPRPCSH